MKLINTLIIISYILVNFCSSAKQNRILKLKPNSKTTNFLEIKEASFEKDKVIKLNII